MSDLKLSIIILFVFIVTLLGVSNVESFQESVVDFSPIFFVLIALVVFSELIVVGRLIKAGVRLSQYATIVFWLVIYVLIWYFYLREDKPLDVNLIQGLLVLLSAVLAFDVGRRIDQTDFALDALTISTYPNRSLEIQSAKDTISAEITRSRRYHHPLSVLTVRLEGIKSWDDRREINLLADDLLERFAIAKMNKILSDHARSTDVVLREGSNQFILICPETNQASMAILSDRIAKAVRREMSAQIKCGSALFPDEAVTFDDLLNLAKERLVFIESRETDLEELEQL